MDQHSENHHFSSYQGSSPEKLSLNSAAMKTSDYKANMSVFSVKIVLNRVQLHVYTS